MRRPGISVSGLLVAAALYGSGVWRTVSGQEPRARRLSRDVTAGWTPMQRLGPIASDDSQAAEVAERQAVIDGLMRQGIDLHELPRRDSFMIHFGLPAEDLAAAVHRSHLIVVGTAGGMRAVSRSSVEVEFAVERTLKGEVRSVIAINFLGGPCNLPGWGLFLAEAGAMRLLLPGDRAVVFLEQWWVMGGVRYTVLPFAGR